MGRVRAVYPHYSDAFWDVLKRDGSPAELAKEAKSRQEWDMVEEAAFRAGKRKIMNLARKKKESANDEVHPLRMWAR